MGSVVMNKKWSAVHSQITSSKAEVVEIRKNAQYGNIIWENLRRPEVFRPGKIKYED